MSAMPDQQPLRYPVESIVLVDDEEIVSLYPYIKEVKVDMSRSAATTCTLLLDSIRDETGEWLVQDAGILDPWKKIKVQARFGDVVEDVMSGYIREVKVEYPPDMSTASVTVTGQDESLLLDREHVRRTWSTAAEPLSDGQLVQQIANNTQLQANAEEGLTNTSLNSDGTYINLLKERAEANGFELYVRNGTINFHPIQLEGTPQPTIMVYAGLATNCLRFSAQYDGHLPDRVRVVRSAETGTDNEDHSVGPNLHLLGTTAANSETQGLPDFEWVMQQPNGATEAEVQSRAQAKANENAWKVKAEGELDGALYGHVLLTHDTVEVDGTGLQYGGRYYVDEVSHKFSLEGYRQAFKLLRNALGEEGG